MMKWSAYLLAAMGFGGTIWLIANVGAGEVLHAFELAGWGIGLLLPLHAAVVAIDASGWRVLLSPADPNRHAHRLFLFWAASVREAVGRLLPVASVGGDLLGVRLVVQRDISGPIAAASVAVEIWASLIGQYLLTVLAVALLIYIVGADETTTALVFGLLLGLPALGVAAVLLARARLFERLATTAIRLLGDPSFLPSRDSAAELDRRVRALLADLPRMARAIAWQFAGMVLSAAEIWLAAYLIEVPVSPAEALVIEGLTQGVRYLAFFVPGALGVQEAGFVFFGGLLGLSADTALSLSLIRRVRELAYGLPMLASWQWFEVRQARRAAAEDASNGAS